MKLNRLNKILSKMQENNIPQMLVTDPKAIFYLTGKMIHPGERLIALYLNTNGNHKLFINELFPVYEDLGVEKVWFDDTKDGVLIISEYIEKEKTIGIDKNWPARFLLHLMELNTENKYVNASFIIDTLRMCKDEEEKKRLQEIYAQNEKEYQDMLYEKYNPNDIFKKKEGTTIENNNEIKEKMQMVEYKDSVFKRIINKILNFLHLR